MPLSRGVPSFILDLHTDISDTQQIPRDDNLPILRILFQGQEDVLIGFGNPMGADVGCDGLVVFEVDQVLDHFDEGSYELLVCS